ncbi:intradiol ring-cleavage dioxygenase [Phytohabitans rumicis]|uniref:3,4-dioxygenase subunit beta n=1 Tax=Phytohabitans rumicis TaxID=1076125 RepID=A0A6V8LI09_9ACTN|nr:intradiol ring-cleavage dioxygenase [Phytohabitans rumicis]GFJ94541.1 3,4-dioxygenase subunit beta [Phytohabitans rumicis]
MSHDDLHDRGLQFDVSTLWDRRRILGLFAGAGVATLVGCGDDESPTATATSTPTSATATTPAATSTAASGSCEEIPEETAGPYPGDGSNGPNVLSQSGIVRSDIRSSFGSASGTAEGVPLTIKLTLTDTANDCAALSGAAVYLWHCDRDGNYSLYSQAVTNENYLRGVQETGNDGTVTFTSIFPAAYSGRWPHVHFEVYPSLDQATSSDNKIATSQLALPEAVCNTVYATDGYEQSVSNMKQTTLATDNVFSDDKAVHQLATVTGSVSAGYVATLNVPV